MARLKGQIIRQSLHRLPVVRLVIISKNARGTADLNVVIDDQPVTPCRTDIDSPSASAQQTILFPQRTSFLLQ